MSINSVIDKAIKSHQLGEFDDAEKLYKRILSKYPRNAQILHLFGLLCGQTERREDEVLLIKKAVSIKPNFPVAFNDLGVALFAQGNFDTALIALLKAVSLKADYHSAWANLGIIYKEIGEVEKSIEALENAVKCKPDLTSVRSCLIYTTHFNPSFSSAKIFDLHRGWYFLHASSFKDYAREYKNDRSNCRRLRIGYVSADFCHHPVTMFLFPMFENYDRSQFELFIYSNTAVHDDSTIRIKEYVDGWREIVGCSDSEVSELIYEDRIDILVDLSGHTAGNRLMVFARKPAPIQVTYLGYPNTTGLESIDYRITDNFADPIGRTENYHSEELVRLPDSAWCFQPNVNLGIRPRVFNENGLIVFGCFNNLAKLSDYILQIWAEIMIQLPNSKLVIKNSGLRSDSARSRIKYKMGSLGVDLTRIEFFNPTMTYQEHLAFYGEIDVALDTYPYHGTTTTCEALWMGVPVITLEGDCHVSRVGVSLLKNVGLSKLVASSADDYVKIAVELSRNWSVRQEFGVGLREVMERSPIMNAKLFARNLETTYRDMWRKWTGN